MMAVQNLHDGIGPEYKAAVYARSSTSNKNHSTKTQIQLAKELIAREKLILYKIYEDEHTPATDKPFRQRGSFKELLQDAYEGKFKYVIAFRRDRLARNVEELMEIQRIFKKLGIKVLYTYDTNLEGMEPEFRDFVENILAAVSELEPRTIADRIRAGKRKKREVGMYSCNGYLPYGYSFDKNKGFVPLEEKKEYIRKLFKAYAERNDEEAEKLEGKLLKQYEEDNKEKEKSPGSKVRKYKMSKPDIKEMVQKPVYAGYLFIKTRDKFHELFTEDKEKGSFLINEELLVKCRNVPPIVDYETWKNALLRWREDYEQNKKGPWDQSNILRGLLICEKCKKNLTVEGSGKYKNYTCRCRKNGIKVPKDEMMGKVLKAIIKDLVITDEAEKHIKAKIAEVNRKINDLEKEISKIRKEQDKYLSQLFQNSKDTSALKNLEELIKEEKKLKKQIEACETNIHRLKERLDNLDAFSREFASPCNTRIIMSALMKDVNKGRVMLSRLIGKVVIGISDEGEWEIKHKDYSSFRKQPKHKGRKKGK